MADRSLANPRSRSAIDHDHAVRLPSSPLPAPRSPNSTISDPSTPSPNPKRIRTLGPHTTPSSALAAFSVSSPARHISFRPFCTICPRCCPCLPFLIACPLHRVLGWQKEEWVSNLEPSTSIPSRVHCRQTNCILPVPTPALASLLCSVFDQWKQSPEPKQRGCCRLACLLACRIQALLCLPLRPTGTTRTIHEPTLIKTISFQYIASAGRVLVKEARERKHHPATAVQHAGSVPTQE
ncbi:uncharacterized protein B0T23DRAFT_395914 [Neurospora hispaniola]|uniref:Uncharacterized protein n=1 Tax=Neurospora hispaniola TaxID=588809 RepID=A0AAJ0I7U8_9PEZI|nr:hypothetical protein B0T23DRAFT_395914 [Neurospora hispaniola]